jgi:uncharacterized cupin superfamily protein
MDDPKHIVRTGGYDWAKSWRGRHPFNDRSEMRLAPLGAPTGLKRIGVNLIRIPPGKESFIPHAHSVEEEFVFVLEGAGEVVLDGTAWPLGPGDFVGFPTDGVVHSVRATGPGDLVYLTGGQRSAVEVADMPSIGRTTVFRDGRVTLYGTDGAETLTEAEWMARARLPDEG